jgi:hypothetical protein
MNVCFRSLCLWPQIRVYSIFLDERLELFRLLKFDIQVEKSIAATKIREMSSDHLLDILPKLQKAQTHLTGCVPEGAAKSSPVVMVGAGPCHPPPSRLYLAVQRKYMCCNGAWGVIFGVGSCGDDCEGELPLVPHPERGDHLFGGPLLRYGSHKGTKGERAASTSIAPCLPLCVQAAAALFGSHRCRRVDVVIGVLLGSGSGDLQERDRRQ